MRHPLTLALACATTFVLVGCASSSHVLFVTKTSVGIDFDSKPATVSLGYDRIEGYVAPTYPNGEIPPVVASVKSDGGIFSPTIRQVYATGDAAVIATGGKSANKSKPLKGKRAEMMFFGTTTATGLKVGFSTSLPDSFIFGFKRKEFSYIPLAHEGDENSGKDVYPSVLASIDTQANAKTDGSVDGTKLSNAQFFATGRAARNLASAPDIRQGFTAIAAEAVAKQQKENVTEERQQDMAIGALLDNVLEQYADTNAAQQQSILEIAKNLGIDKDGTMSVANFEQKLSIYSSSKPAADVQKNLQALNDRVASLLAK